MREYKFCLRCGYYARDSRPVCKRYPPQVHIINGRAEGIYPPVGRRGIDGCGEWVDNRKPKDGQSQEAADV